MPMTAIPARSAFCRNQAMPLRPQPRRRSISPALAVEWLAYAVSVLAMLAGSAAATNPLWSLCALANYLWLCTLLFRSAPHATALILPLMVSRASIAVALCFIEFGAPIPELGTIGTPGIYASAFVAYTSFYFVAICLMFEPLWRRVIALRPTALDGLMDRNANLFASVILAGALFLILALLLNGLAKGFPLLAGIDRFQFRRFSTSKMTLYALNLKYPIMIMLGLTTFRLKVRPGIKLTSTLCVVSLFVIYFLFGDKFFTQINAFCAFITPYLLFNHERVRRNLAVGLIVVALAVAAVSGVTWEIYSKGGQLSSTQTATLLSGRIVGQGELWYIQVKAGAPAFNWDGRMVSKYLQALTVKNVEYFPIANSIGTAYFSNRYTPPKLRHSLITNAGFVTFTAAQDAIGLTMFGWVGLCGMLLADAVFIAAVASYMAYAIFKRSVISAAIAGMVFVQLDTSLAQAAPWALFSIYAFRWVLMLLVIEVAMRMMINSSTTSYKPASP